MNEREYLSIPDCYMREIPKEVWYSWPSETRKDFLQMISDPNFFFYSCRPFNQEIHGENIELSDYEKKEFWKRIDYFFSSLGITNLKSLDNLWGYFAIPFKHRTGKVLKYYFYLPENNRKLCSALSYYNITSISTQSSRVKIKLIEREAQVFILSFIREFMRSTSRLTNTQDLLSNSGIYIAPTNQNLMFHYGINNEKLFNPSFNINSSDGHIFVPTNLNSNQIYNISQQRSNFTTGYNTFINSNFNPYLDKNQQNLNFQIPVKTSENSLIQIQNGTANDEQFVPYEKRGRGRPRKYPIQDPPPICIPKKRGRKKKSEIKENTYNKEDYNNMPKISINNTGQNENEIINYDYNSNSSVQSENENQEDFKINNHGDKSNSENFDEENEDSDELLRKFIVSDNSYGSDAEDQNDEDYQEVNAKLRNYYSMRSKKKRKNKKRLKSTFKNTANDKLKNISNIQGFGYNRYNTNEFNGYNVYEPEQNFNQIYNNGRNTNLSMLNIQPTSQNQPQQQIYQINRPQQFIQAQHPSTQTQVSFKQVCQMGPPQITANQFQPVTSVQDVHKIPTNLDTVPNHNISIPQNPIVPIIPTQARQIQPTIIPFDNYANLQEKSEIVPNLALLNNKSQLISNDTSQLANTPQKKKLKLSQRSQENSKFNQPLINKIEDNQSVKENILIPKIETISHVPNYIDLNTNKKTPISNENILSAKHINSNVNSNSNICTYPQQTPVDLQNFSLVDPQVQNSQKKIFPGYQHPQPIINYQKQIENQQKLFSNHQSSKQHQSRNLSQKSMEMQQNYDQNYDYENNENIQAEYRRGSPTIEYLDDGKDRKNKIISPYSRSIEDRIESKMQVANEEMNDYDDNELDNIKNEKAEDLSNENESYDDSDEDSEVFDESSQSKEDFKPNLRQRRFLTKESEYNSDENESESGELIGIISHLSYIYEENNKNNEYSRISKMKPSPLTDLEFKQSSV